MRKSRSLQQQQQQGQDSAKLRRSSRVRQSPAVFDNSTTRCENNKRKHIALQVENEEQELTVTPSGKPLLFISDKHKIACVCVCVRVFENNVQSLHAAANSYISI